MSIPIIKEMILHNLISHVFRTGLIHSVSRRVQGGKHPTCSAPPPIPVPEPTLSPFFSYLSHPKQLVSVALQNLKFYKLKRKEDLAWGFVFSFYPCKYYPQKD